MAPETTKQYKKALKELAGLVPATGSIQVDDAQFCKKHDLKPSFFLALRDLDCLVLVPGTTPGNRYRRTDKILKITPEEVSNQMRASGRKVNLIDNDVASITAHFNNTRSQWVATQTETYPPPAKPVEAAEPAPVEPDPAEPDPVEIEPVDQPIANNDEAVTDPIPDEESAMWDKLDALIEAAANAYLPEAPSPEVLALTLARQIVGEFPSDPNAQLKLFRAIGHHLRSDMNQRADALEEQASQYLKLAEQWRQLSRTVTF
ncbi:hypothetical protein FAES_3954 [Fibrella aestuarina BUZ 2]|uniref:Uncharacterized protein n=1 Tax=Fibrella aestuarina BUZ 2 TaxID=1166018 RepID=I0KCV4_9BACT|nr:hypothetical protein [Fibrella aestuarina]CCH01957.1 hypothetical protein FAES_3954 [Fibrella aestuarina BUZ 2]